MNKNRVEIPATLIRKEEVKNKSGDVVVEHHRNIKPVIIEIDTKEERHALATDFAIKFLESMGFEIVISEEKFKSLEDKSTFKSVF